MGCGQGSWVSDQRNGHGIYTWAAGNTFSGMWQKHKAREGVVTMSPDWPGA